MSAAAAASSSSVNTVLNNVNAKGAVFAGNFEGNIDARVSNQTVINNHEAILKLYKERESGELDHENCTVEAILKDTSGSHTMAVGTYHNTSCIFKMFNGVDDDSLIKEAKRMKKLSSQNANICPCFGIVKFPADYKKKPEVAGKTFSVLEKQPYSLDIVLKSKNLTDLTRYTIILGLLRALAFMSQSSPPVVHGDLANTQVLVSAAHQAILIDLNASVELKSMLTQSILSTNKVGLYQWKAPELFEGEPKSRESDVYSFGLLLFTICRCDAISSVDGEVKQPWGELSISEVSDLVLKGRRPATLEQLIEKHKIPAIISHIIVSAWSQNPSARLGGAGVGGIRNLFDTHGEAVLQLPEEKYPGWLKFNSPASSSSSSSVSSPPPSSTKSNFATEKGSSSSDFDFYSALTNVDDDVKIKLQQNKFSVSYILKKTVTVDLLVKLGFLFVDAETVVEFFDWVKQRVVARQVLEAKESTARQAFEKQESSTRVVIEEEAERESLAEVEVTARTEAEHKLKQETEVAARIDLPRTLQKQEADARIDIQLAQLKWIQDLTAKAKAMNLFSTPVWQDKENVSECRKCKKEFGLFTWKHHCRYDGLIYCDDCTDYSLPRSLVPNPALPPGTTSDTSSETFKVCINCYSKVLPEQMKKQLALKWSSRKRQQPANDGFINQLLQTVDPSISKSAIETVLKYVTVATTDFWSLTDLDISYMLGEENGVQADKIFRAHQYLNEEHWNELNIPVDAESVEYFLSKGTPAETFPLDAFRVADFVSQLVKVTPKRSETTEVHSLIFRNFAFLSDEGRELLGRQEVVDSLVAASQFISSAEAVDSWSRAITDFVFNNELNTKLFGCSSIRDTIVFVSKYATTAEAVQWWSSAINNITLNNESNQKLFGCHAVVDSFVGVSNYVTTAEAVEWWSSAISNIALPASNGKLFGCSSIRDSFVAVSKYVTSADAAQSWTLAISNMTLVSNEKLFGCSSIRDSFIAVSTCATTAQAVRCWVTAINNITFTASNTVGIKRVFISSSEFKQAFFSLKQKLVQMGEDEDTREAKKWLGAAEKRLF